jgi:hypothetical protein
MRKAANLLAIVILTTFITGTPASADLQILPPLLKITHEIHGVRFANWGPTVALGGAIHFERLQLVLRGDAVVLSYFARVSRLAPMQNVIRVDLFSGTDLVGTLEFGRWSHDCSNKNEQRGVTRASGDLSRFDVADAARLYIVGGGWSNCPTT